VTWQIGVATGCCTDVPIVDVIAAASQARLTGVELGTVPGHFDPWNAHDLQAVRTRLAETGVQPVSIHAPFGGLLDLSAPDSHHRYAAMGAILSSVSALEHLEGRIVVVHPTDVERQGTHVQARLDQTLASLSMLARTCAAMGLTLAVETPLPHLIGGHPDEFAWILARLDPKVGVCIDTGHVSLVDGYWDRFLALAGRRIVHVHAHDNHGRYDDHLPPGDGVLNWQAIGDGLRQVPFTGWIILELSTPREPLTSYFARALRQTIVRFGPPPSPA
jgi:sugar phosphate isomerase/epimerase